MAYYVYILTNKPRGALYIGVTGRFLSRINQHKSGAYEGFSKKYHLKMLVYQEWYDEVGEAIAREKNLKRWNRAWKIHLIEQQNPYWVDQARGWDFDFP